MLRMKYSQSYNNNNKQRIECAYSHSMCVYVCVCDAYSANILFQICFAQNSNFYLERRKHLNLLQLEMNIKATCSSKKTRRSSVISAV